MVIAMASGTTAIEEVIAGMVVAGMDDIEPDNKKPAESDVLAGFWLNVVIFHGELVGRRHSYSCRKATPVVIAT